MTTTIHVKQSTKDRLDSLKVHSREPYNDVIERLIDFYERYVGVVGNIEEGGDKE